MDAHCRSQCGCDGHSLRSCHEPTEKESAVDGAGGSGEIMLFGVRVKLDHMRKSVSLNNLSQYEGPNDNTRNSEPAKISADEGYASADDAVLNQPSSGGRERKRGIPWTEEEHKLFLLGLQKVGKGDWRGISRNFVKTRTPTQVASHAQKYFLRRSNLNRRRRRSSLFDITTDSVAPMSAEEPKAPTENSNPAIPLPISESSQINPFAVASTPGQITYILQPIQVEERPMQNQTMARTDEVSDPSPMFTLPVPILSLNNSSTPIGLNLNESIESEPSSLSLSLSLPLNQSHSSSSRHLGMPSFSNEDTFITVA